jgi:hypothetical protein
MATTKESTQEETTNMHSEHFGMKYNFLMERYYSDLSRLSTGMFASVIVAITFLLLAGLRTPHVLLLVFMYSALGAFALTILTYVVMQMLRAKLMMKKMACEKAKEEGADNLERLEGEKAQAKKWVKVSGMVLQVLFVLGLIAIVGFSIEVSMLFFVPTAQPAAAGAAQ